MLLKCNEHGIKIGTFELIKGLVLGYGSMNKPHTGVWNGLMYMHKSIDNIFWKKYLRI